ncbi:MAG: hypothetical protein SFW36_06575 [Leptolyngbyaceae cyanobacterium bins.59]|nr:hypothetical protein [Leptolyngbyaceae cyanobacterium bins.59]
MFNVDSADFRVHIDLMVHALKTRDRKIIHGFEKPFSALLGSKYVRDLAAAAINQLALSDRETCTWVLSNYYEPSTYSAMKQRAIRSALQILLDQGFVRGRDFLLTAADGIQVRSEVRETLAHRVSGLDRLLLESVIEVIY